MSQFSIEGPVKLTGSPAPLTPATDTESSPTCRMCKAPIEKLGGICTACHDRVRMSPVTLIRNWILMVVGCAALVIIGQYLSRWI